MGNALKKLQKLKEEKEKLGKIDKEIREKDTGIVGRILKRGRQPTEKPAEQKKTKDVLIQKPAAVLGEPELQNPKKEKDGQEKKSKRGQAKREQKKQKKSAYEQRRFFLNIIWKAGIDTSFEEINKWAIISSGTPVFAVALYIIIDSAIKAAFFTDIVSLVLPVVVFGFVGLYLAIWTGFFFYVDLKIYKRRKEIEAVFPDFLQLTAANINSGMPIDRALWFAIRPRFGILAKEMENVAKATMVGENLGKALLAFSEKYDSIMIKRALNLLLEGLESGGEIGDLLTRVADNMRETEILKKEMASSVTTYVIFILFATLGAAPFLFGLTTQLIVIMKSILSNINVDASSQGGIGFSMGSGESISVGDYQIFAMTSIALSSVFAAILISVIQKGDAKEALKKIPLYVGIGLVNYFVAFKLLNLLLGGFFK